MWAASIAAVRGLCKATGANCPKIRLNLYYRSSAPTRGVDLRHAGLQFFCYPRAGPRVAETLGPHRHQRRAGGRGTRPRRRRWRPRPYRSKARSTAARTARSCCSAIGRTAGPESPPWPAARAGCPVAGSIALAFSVLIRETASAPPSSAATATASGLATFGVSFTINGFSVSGRSASSSASVSSGLLADDQAGVHVGTGDVQLDSRDLVPLRDLARPAARTAPGSSPSPRRSTAPATRPAAADPRPGSPPGPCSAARSS